MRLLTNCVCYLNASNCCFIRQFKQSCVPLRILIYFSWCTYGYNTAKQVEGRSSYAHVTEVTLYLERTGDRVCVCVSAGANTRGLLNDCRFHHWPLEAHRDV